MERLMEWIRLFLLALLTVGQAQGMSTVPVADDAALRRAIAAARPGARIELAPGTYRGDLWFHDLHGEPGRPIVLAAANPRRPPVIRGGDTGLHLSDVSHVELDHLAVDGARGNGINIDDGGTFETPSHHIILRGLVVRDIGPEGNRDGIKLSGVDEFRVEDCTIERWGSDGSAIDMVGCHRGEIVGCRFRHADEIPGNGVQAKGGSSDVAIRRCRFEHAGSRAVNLGGSTGLQFFRPRPQGYEAKGLTVEDCTFLGSAAPIAFVGVDGAEVRHNTIYRPRRWCLRILQETTEPGFAPCRNGRFHDNLIAFRSGEMTVPINIGPATAPETFVLSRNAWYCLDDPARSRPELAIAEVEGVYGSDPRFRDAERGDLGLRAGSPLSRYGVRDGRHDRP
jgi:Right handed beta helix region